MSLLNALVNNQWAIDPLALQRMAGIAARRAFDLEALAPKAGVQLKNTRLIQLIDGTAVVPVTGPLFPKASLMDTMCGAVSLETLMQEMQQALDNPNVNAIVLDMDSPGGLVSGTSEFAAFITRAKDIKPIVCYVGGSAASAAYWIASACSEIVAEKTAGLGSIGVVTARPVQQEPDQNGDKWIEIVSSNAQNKRPDPTTEGGLKVITDQLDAVEALFIADVASNRGVTVQKVKDTFGKGGMLIAADAVQAGMADRIGSFESVLSELSNRFYPNRNGGQMSNQKPAAAADTAATQATVETLTAQHPALVAQIQAASALAERARITAIDEVSVAGHEALVQAAKEDGKSTAADVALKIVKATKAQGADYLNATVQAVANQPKIDASASNGNGPTPPAKDGEDTGAYTEEKGQAAWDKMKPAARAEFGNDFKAFHAFTKAEQEGRTAGEA
jgi:ClpP class serine protease